MYNGIVNVYKEAGFTSFDVVAKLRGVFGQKKIGHTGTLDPEAVGVLPVCLGNGTKLCDVLTDKSKEYLAVMKLGERTDTQDATGEILEKKPVEVSDSEIEATVNSFIGDYNQIPPMYSALKQNGKKLYELARAGIEVERKPRLVNISSIVIEKIELPFVTMRVNCSKGTYIRTLCDDIGASLGFGALMQSLTRTRVGVYKIENALKISDLQELKNAGKLEEAVCPVDEVFEEYPKAYVNKEADKYLKNGNSLDINELLGAMPEKTGVSGKENASNSYKQEKPAEVIRVYDYEGRFCGLYEYDRSRKNYKVKKMFLS